MSEELYFNNELRKCLNATVFSDCGDNDQWNYWYQRVHKAHDQAVDRVTEAQRAENAKQRELLLHMQTCMEHLEYPEYDCSKCPLDNSAGNCDFERRMQELGILSHDGQ